MSSVKTGTYARFCGLYNPAWHLTEDIVKYGVFCILPEPDEVNFTSFRSSGDAFYDRNREPELISVLGPDQETVRYEHGSKTNLFGSCYHSSIDGHINLGSVSLSEEDNQMMFVIPGDGFHCFVEHATEFPWRYGKIVGSQLSSRYYVMSKSFTYEGERWRTAYIYHVRWEDITPYGETPYVRPTVWFSRFTYKPGSKRVAGLVGYDSMRSPGGKDSTNGWHRVGDASHIFFSWELQQASFWNRQYPIEQVGEFYVCPSAEPVARILDSLFQKEYSEANFTFISERTTFATEAVSLKNSLFGSEDRVQALLNSSAPLWLHEAIQRSENSASWGEIAADAYQNLGMWDGNGVSFIKESFEQKESLKGEASALLTLARKLTTERKSKNAVQSAISAAANAYLGIHYGLKLTVLDVSEMIDRFKKMSLSSKIKRCSSTRKGSFTTDNNHVVRYTRQYQTLYSEMKALENLLSAYLTETDLTLSGQDLWDMVPYSFVVDWFVHVGDFLTALQNYSTVRTVYETICSFQTTNVSSVVNLTELSQSIEGVSSSSLLYNIYARKCRRNPIPPIYTEILTTVNPLHQHSVEAGALIVQKLL